ncbi:U-box domain-containing protein 38-like [Rutidosis leptorrhynchoides]|uniref:U-box domain-containing protein 38-like n=1 Tax=Rutidosis leptorrhynchoides TaxID=125765 RepID=UPI003A995A70
MGGNGKHSIWKISFYRRSSSKKQPPKEFHCPISGSLMADPVVVSSGQTFERNSVQACRELNYIPELEDGSRPDFSAGLIPNLALRTAIGTWCDENNTERPRVPDYYSVEKAVRAMIGNDSKSISDIMVSERELLKGVAENPPVIFSHAATELGHRVNHFQFNSSSSEESVIVGSEAGTASATASPLTPLPLTTRPVCYSSSSSCSFESSETLAFDHNRNRNSSSAALSGEEEEILSKLRSSDIHELEKAVISLRKITKTKEDLRISLCNNSQLLSVLKHLIVSRFAIVQTNVVASIVNLSLEKSNKITIVRSGFVPLLIDVLKSAASNESQEHAAGALFSLALEDENKMAIGVLGGLQPLLHSLRSESDRTWQDSALALYHLSLIHSNRVKLVKLGAVPSLLSMVRSNELAAGRVLLVLCNLAACNEGRSAMLEANAVGIFVNLLREGNLESEATRENCVAALLGLSHGSLRFKGLAKEARAIEVLREIEVNGSERAREKAKKILLSLRTTRNSIAEFGSGKEEPDWEAALLSSGGVSWARHRAGANSTNF